MEFKNRIRQLREESNMSVTQLAAFFDKSEAAIRMWETGKSKPDVDTLIKLANRFACSTDYLLGLSSMKNEETFKDFEDEINETLEELDKLPSDPRGYLTGMFRNLVANYGVLQDHGNVQDTYIFSMLTIITYISASAYFVKEATNLKESNSDKKEQITRIIFKLTSAQKEVVNGINDLYDEFFAIFPEYDKMVKEFGQISSVNNRYLHNINSFYDNAKNK